MQWTHVLPADIVVNGATQNDKKIAVPLALFRAIDILYLHMYACVCVLIYIYIYIYIYTRNITCLPVRNKQQIQLRLDYGWCRNNLHLQDTFLLLVWRFDGGDDSEQTTLVQLLGDLYTLQ